ncbi:MAG: class I tRNA ligase family protein, partial [Candidatus Pacebacteria bacterium]|nr:class I tRNA ligase family protein [Candidatus Paceibacterota bacterium]
VTSGMESYDMVSGTRPIEGLIEDLSTWYLRRSRERIKEGDKEAKQTMYFVLKNLAKMLAPFTPFIAEDVWQKLKNEKDVESVHLAEWPEVIKFNKDILTSMQLVRDICNVGNMLRKKENVPLRQPLATLYIDKEVNKEYEEIIKDELNVKSLEKGEEISFDMKITEELKQEGMYREFVRAVQDVRKEENKKPDDIVVLNVETDSSGKDLINKWQSQISKIVGAKEVVFVENSGKEVKIDTIVFKISLE